MKKIAFTVAVACLVVAAASGFSSAKGSFTVDGGGLGRLEFPLPEQASERKYLGLSGSNTFRLPSVKAELLIIELFSMYCPICQAEAENVNRLYRRIEGDRAMKDRVKILGIGAGNTPFEVNVFRDKFKIPFPLLPDDAFRIRAVCSEDIRTPTFVTVRMERGRPLEVVDSHIGPISDTGEFLKRVTRQLNRKGGRP